MSCTFNNYVYSLFELTDCLTSDLPIERLPELISEFEICDTAKLSPTPSAFADYLAVNCQHKCAAKYDALRFAFDEACFSWQEIHEQFVKAVLDWLGEIRDAPDVLLAEQAIASKWFGGPDILLALADDTRLDKAERLTDILERLEDLTIMDSPETPELYAPPDVSPNAWASTKGDPVGEYALRRQGLEHLQALPSPVSFDAEGVTVHHPHCPQLRERIGWSRLDSAADLGVAVARLYANALQYRDSAWREAVCDLIEIVCLRGGLFLQKGGVE